MEAVTAAALGKSKQVGSVRQVSGGSWVVCEDSRTREFYKHALSRIILIFRPTCESSRLSPLMIKTLVKTAGRLLRRSCRPSYWSLHAGHVNIDFLTENILWLVEKHKIFLVGTLLRVKQKIFSSSKYQHSN